MKIVIGLGTSHSVRFISAQHTLLQCFKICSCRRLLGNIWRSNNSFQFRNPHYRIPLLHFRPKTGLQYWSQDERKQIMARRERKMSDLHFFISPLHTSSASTSVWPGWAIYWTLGNFLKPLATIILPKPPTFLGKFCKGVKIHPFLVKSFLVNFYRHLAFFSGHTSLNLHLLRLRLLVLAAVWPDWAIF